MSENSEDVENINTREYWDGVYDSEFDTRKKRIDNERLSKLTQEIDRLIEEGESKDEISVLDVAGGAGELSRFLAYEYPGIKVTSVDFSPRAIEIARNILERLVYQVDDAQVLSGVSDDSQDIIFAGEVLEHLDSDFLCVQNVMRCLKIGGRAVFTVPMKDRNRSPEHVREYDLNNILDLLGRFGRIVHLDVVGNYVDWFSIVAIVERVG